MAASISRVNIFNAVAKRGYAAAPKVAASTADVNTTSLPNKTTVVSIGCPKPLVKVAVAFKAGSRYETPENYGASHIIRSSTGLSTGCASSFSIQRNLQQLGASITTLQDRETIVYILEATSNKLPESLDYLRYTIVNQEFRPWELQDNVKRILTELALIPPQARVLDLLHVAAFRSGLGNSIFAKKFNVKKIGSETLQHFASTLFVGERTVVAGCGIEHKDLSQFAECLQLKPASGASAKPSPYIGGEIRLEKDLPLVHVAVAGPAPGLNSADVLASAVAKYALGSGSSVKYGSSAGPLGKISGNPAAASAFSIAHSDAGLFGLYIASKPTAIKEALTDALKSLKKGVSDQDVERGKAQLKSAILFSADSTQGLVEDIAGQALLADKAKSPLQLVEEVSKVSKSQVSQVIEKATSGKMSIASVGSTFQVPYLDQL